MTKNIKITGTAKDEKNTFHLEAKEISLHNALSKKRKLVIKLELLEEMKMYYQKLKPKISGSVKIEIETTFKYIDKLDEKFIKFAKKIPGLKTDKNKKPTINIDVEKILTKPILSNDVELFTLGYIWLANLYIQIRKPTKKEYKPKKEVKDRDTISPFFSNQLAVSKKANVYSLRDLDVSTFSFLYYLLNQITFDTAKEIQKTGQQLTKKTINIDYPHMQKTLKIKSHNFIERLYKNVDDSQKSQFNIKLDKGRTKSFNIIDNIIYGDKEYHSKDKNGEEIIYYKIESITFTDSTMEHILPLMAIYNKIDVSVYDVLRLNRTTEDHLLMTKFLEIRVNILKKKEIKPFKQTIIKFADMVSYEIPDREIKRKFKGIIDRVLKRIKNDLQKIEYYKITTKDIIVKFK